MILESIILIEPQLILSWQRVRGRPAGPETKAAVEARINF